MNKLAFGDSPYENARAAVHSERSVEYQAFAKVTSELARLTHESSFQTLTAAVHQNRKLWNTLAADVMSDDNQLPVKLRASIFSIAQFVSRHSAKVLNKNASCEPLIDINKSIMRGLNH